MPHAGARVPHVSTESIQNISKSILPEMQNYDELKRKMKTINLTFSTSLLLLSLLFAHCEKTDTLTKSSEKSISSFSLSKLSPSVSGVIDQKDHTVKLTIPFGQSAVALVPEISVSPGAEVSPKSGEAVNFSSPVTYTVTAEDGTKAAYTVTVTNAADPLGITEYKDVILGWTDNTQIGQYFSTKTGKVYKESELIMMTSHDADIAYVGVDGGVNFFCSLNDTALEIFELSTFHVGTALFTNYHNSILTAEMFDNMTNAEFFKSMKVVHDETPFYGSPLPRVVLFQTPKGLKGAIKVKSKKRINGLGITTVDIKVQNML
jgi:hypothetical protein